MPVATPVTTSLPSSASHQPTTISPPPALRTPAAIVVRAGNSTVPISSSSSSFSSSSSLSIHTPLATTSPSKSGLTVEQGIGIVAGVAVFIFVVTGIVTAVLLVRRNRRQREAVARVLQLRGEGDMAAVLGYGSRPSSGSSRTAAELEGSAVPRELPYNSFVREAPDTTVHEAPSPISDDDWVRMKNHDSLMSYLEK